jgi:pilus assembly protein CpaC
MHPTATSKRRLLWGLVLTAGFAGLVQAQPPGTPLPPDAVALQDKKTPEAKEQPKDRDTGVPDVKIDPRTNALIIPVGGFVRFDPKLPEIPADILVSREDFVQVRLDPANPKVLLLTGRAPGLAQVTLLFKDRPRMTYDVVVQPDFELLRTIIRRTAPTANVEVTPGLGNTLILSGYVTTPQDADTIFRLAVSQVGGTAANVINMLQIGGVQQVQIDVVIATVDRSEIRNRGFDFAISGRTVTFSSLVSGLLTPPTGFGSGTVTFGQPANLQLGIAPAGFFAALQALRTEGLAKFLAEPKVVTQSGRPAQFLAGGRQATLGPSSGINGPGVVLEQVGTQLNVVPIVMGNGKIWLEVSPSTRTVNQGLGIQTVFGATPGFSENSLQVAVELENGQTFAIGGLIQNSVSATAARVPVLGDLPFIGAGFSNLRYEERESELVVLVTPRLVNPMDCSQTPRRLPGRETRSPDDYEFFLENILEAPRGQRKVWNGRCYNAAWKCDPTAAVYPCVGNVCYGPNGTLLPGGGCGPTGCAPAATPGHAGHALRAMPAPVMPTIPVQPAVTPVSAPQPAPTPAEAAGTPVVPGAPVEVPAQLPATAEPNVLPLAPVVPLGPGR